MSIESSEHGWEPCDDPTGHGQESYKDFTDTTSGRVYSGAFLIKHGGGGFKMHIQAGWCTDPLYEADDSGTQRLNVEFG